MKWISAEGLAEELAISKDTIRGWKGRHWTKDVHYIVVGQTTLVDRREVVKWLESRKVSNSAEGRSGSRSGGKARESRRLIQANSTPSTSAA